jgi:hypothetical protein
MVDPDISQINIENGSDECALQYLGAAVVITWARLPSEVREMLLKRSMRITRLPETVELEAKINSLLRKHSKPDGGKSG